MAELNYAFCPSCKKEARGIERVQKLFGLRNNAGNMQVQSHCKKCRGREQRIRRHAGLEKHRKIIR